MSTDPKYWAFISYSHADAKFAQWIHKQLETFPVPRKLIGSDTERGYQVPKRLFPIFRDRDELPGSSNLADNINTALQQSRYLIVICSPRSAASQWVNQEVMAFKAMHRANRVLCVIIDGEPNATDKPESGLLECFPPGVRYELASDGKLSDQRAEPIAADARDGKDGRADALLKLASGLLGLGFDELKQREQIRKRRQRLLYVTASLMLMAGIATAGHKIWKEQERANQEAESTQAVLNFLLNDLLSQADSRTQADSTDTANPNLSMREALDRAGERIRGQFEEKPWIEASIQSVMAKTYAGLGDHKRSEAHGKRALEISMRVAGPENAATIEDMHDYGVILMNCAKFKESESLLNKALSTSSKKHGGITSATIDILESLAVLHKRQGKFDKSEELYRRVIDYKTKSDGFSNRETIQTLINLAIVLRSKGQIAEAEAVYRKTLKDLTETLGPSHPDSLVVMDNLGVLLRHKGEIEEAEALTRQSLESRKKAFGENHEETLASYLNLGVILSEQGKTEEALDAFEEIMKIHESKLGFDHPTFLNAANNYAIALIENGELDKAGDILVRVLESREKTLGKEHPITITSVNNMASFLAIKGDVDQARRFYERALTGNENALGKNHSETLNSLINLYDLLVSSGNFKAAEPLARRKYIHDKENLGNGAKDSTNSAQALAFVLSRINRASEGAQILIEHAKGSQKLQEEFRYNIACYQCLSGNLSDAKRLIAEEISMHPNRKQEALQDKDLAAIHDFIGSLAK